MKISKQQVMKFRDIGVFAVLIVTLLLLFNQCMIWATTPADYETRDIADYGKYVGHSEEYMYDYIGRFFPAEISEHYQDITYVFRSRAVDVYGFEAYLEFVIEDDGLFKAHVQSATEGLVSGTFHYDPSFQEYILRSSETGMVYDHIMLGRLQDNIYGPGTCYGIDYADIAKILVDHDAHRIIYIAMSVFDGGASDTEWFNTYFSRFGIDPKEYERATAEIPSAKHPSY